MHYRRHLPHEVPPGFPIFLTWNLKGSLPRPVLEALKREQQLLKKKPRRAGETNADRLARHWRALFAKRDEFLDSARDGPMWLKDPQAAQTVVASILWGVPERYDLYAWVVMANHVHALLNPCISLDVITQGIKGYTAHQINTLQNKRGRTFWQDESYDHWARDAGEMLRIIAYIENNPVAAGLCTRAEDWQWSSAGCRATLEWKPGEGLCPEWKERLLRFRG